MNNEQALALAAELREEVRVEQADELFDRYHMIDGVERVLAVADRIEALAAEGQDTHGKMHFALIGRDIFCGEGKLFNHWTLTRSNVTCVDCLIAEQPQASAEGQDEALEALRVQLGDMADDIDKALDFVSIVLRDKEQGKPIPVEQDTAALMILRVEDKLANAIVVVTALATGAAGSEPVTCECGHKKHRGRCPYIVGIGSVGETFECMCIFYKPVATEDEGEKS